MSDIWHDFWVDKKGGNMSGVNSVLKGRERLQHRRCHMEKWGCRARTVKKQTSVAFSNSFKGCQLWYGLHPVNFNGQCSKQLLTSVNIYLGVNYFLRVQECRTNVTRGRERGKGRGKRKGEEKRGRGKREEEEKRGKIPPSPSLLPCTWTCFLVWGEKDTPLLTRYI